MTKKQIIYTEMRSLSSRLDLRGWWQWKLGSGGGSGKDGSLGQLGLRGGGGDGEAGSRR